jgi:hypothetical protein
MIHKNWQELIKPTQLEVKPGNDPARQATVIAEPLERGFGLTLGNALRRVLMSSLQGAAITSVQIDNVLHEFSSVAGVREDVTDIVLNLKGVAIRMEVEGPKRLTISAKGPRVVTAGDISESAGIEILNKDHVSATSTTARTSTWNSPSTPARATSRPTRTGPRTRRSASCRSTRSTRPSARSATRSADPRGPGARLRQADA